MIRFEIKIEENEDKEITNVGIRKMRKSKNQEETKSELTTAGMVYNAINKALQELQN